MIRVRSTVAIAVSLLLHAGLLGLMALHASVHVAPPPTPVTVVTLESRPMPAPAPSPPKTPEQSGVAALPESPVIPKARPRPIKPATKPRPAPQPKPQSAVQPTPSAVATPSQPPVKAPAAADNAPPPAAPAAPSTPSAPPPAPAPAATGVSISASYAASNRKPVQPAMSRRREEQGTVILRVLVKADGSAGQVEVRTSSSYPMLDEAAREAVQEWRFNPATRDGKPVPEWYLVPVTFKLSK